jgi:hypothetical protein
MNKTILLFSFIAIAIAMAQTAYAQGNIPEQVADYDEDERDGYIAEPGFEHQQQEPDAESEPEPAPAKKKKAALEKEDTSKDSEKSEIFKDMTFGLRIGFNMHQYSEDDFYPAMTMGYGGGVVVKYPLMDNLNIYSELALYFRQICDHKESNPDGSQGTYVAYEYAISIPVLLQYSPIENFYIAAGAQLDVPRGAMKETNGEGEDITEFRGFDAGAVLGLGYMITPNIGVDLRGIMVMTPFVEIEGKVYGKLKHYGLGVTYFF